MNGFVVLFGSAAAGAAAPRDLDVVVGGQTSAADAVSAAQAWWLVEHHGTQARDDLAQQLRDTPPPPVEVTRQRETYRDGSVYLLRPRGAETTAIVLRGECVVRWSDVDSLPAAIRLATDGYRDLASDMMSRLLREGGDRVPLSLADYDKGSPIGAGGYSGDGPVALERALSRIDREAPLGEVMPSPFPAALNSLLTTIRACPGVWSGTLPRVNIADKGPVFEGLRHYWQDCTPLGCRGYVGPIDIVLEYGRKIPISLVEDIIVASDPTGTRP